MKKVKSRGSSRSGGGGGIARSNSFRAVTRPSPKVHMKPMGVRETKSEMHLGKFQTHPGNFWSKISRFNGHTSNPPLNPKAHIKPGLQGTFVKQLREELKKNNKVLPHIQPLVLLKNVLSKLSPKKDDVQKKKSKPSDASGNVSKYSTSIAKIKSGKMKKNKFSDGGNTEKEIRKLKDITQPMSKKTDKLKNVDLDSILMSKTKTDV